MWGTFEHNAHTVTCFLSHQFTLRDHKCITQCTFLHLGSHWYSLHLPIKGGRAEFSRLLLIILIIAKCQMCHHFQHDITVLLLLLQCHGDAVKHARTASCIPSIVFWPQPRVLLVWVRGPSSGNRPKYYQSSASSVVLGVCFRKHDHTGLDVAIGKVAFWLHGRNI